jgi:hypothetical protein
MNTEQIERVKQAARVHCAIHFGELNLKLLNDELEAILRTLDGDESAHYLKMIESQLNHWQAVLYPKKFI